jgi:hypothetical protein
VRFGGRQRNPISDRFSMMAHLLARQQYGFNKLQTI